MTVWDPDKCAVLLELDFSWSWDNKKSKQDKKDWLLGSVTLNTVQMERVKLSAVTSGMWPWEPGAEREWKARSLEDRVSEGLRSWAIAKCM